MRRTADKFSKDEWKVILILGVIAAILYLIFKIIGA
ncbi:MAG: hypothetical protein UZ04_CHB001001477 [Chlorobi bacterium OLB4]|jgi:hypothetical protein|nr:MAG: hypothetical protein UZ04_CHB001001477 [Chlorobi bacterium OLB4]MBV6399565.1 hypothetical protein [Ignavibacteria bacterium]